MVFLIFMPFLTSISAYSVVLDPAHKNQNEQNQDNESESAAWSEPQFLLCGQVGNAPTRKRIKTTNNIVPRDILLLLSIYLSDFAADWCGNAPAGDKPPNYLVLIFSTVIWFLTLVTP